MAPEPILCFDGDAAGRRAAFRAVETALPHLQPGYSVQFAFLPDGLDPDDLVRQHGAGAFQDILATQDAAAVRRADGARGAAGPAGASRRSSGPPWRRASRPWSPASPTAACATSTSASCGRRCGQKNRKLVRELTRSRWPARRRNSPASGATTPSSTGACAERANERARLGAPAAGSPRRDRAGAGPTNSPSARSPLPPREALLVADPAQPSLAAGAQCEEVAELTLTSPPLARLRDALLELLSTGNPLDQASVRSHLSDIGLGQARLPWPSGRSRTRATSLW